MLLLQRHKPLLKELPQTEKEKGVGGQKTTTPNVPTM